MSGVFTFLTIIVLLSIAPFIDFSIRLMYLGALILGTYIFIIVMSSSWIDSLIITECPSLSLVIIFMLNSILSDVSIASPAFF